MFFFGHWNRCNDCVFNKTRIPDFYSKHSRLRDGLVRGLYFSLWNRRNIWLLGPTDGRWSRGIYSTGSDASSMICYICVGMYSCYTPVVAFISFVCFQCIEWYHSYFKLKKNEGVHRNVAKAGVWISFFYWKKERDLISWIWSRTYMCMHVAPW